MLESDPKDKEQNPPKPSNIHTIMENLLNDAYNMRYQNIDDSKRAFKDKLTETNLDITAILDSNNNTLAHLAVIEDHEESVQIIVEAYAIILGKTETFFNWFLSENNSGERTLELSAQTGNRTIISYLYEIISKTSEMSFRITEKRKGIFHYAAMANQCYSIIFYYEKLQKFHKNCQIINVPNEDGVTPLHFASMKACRKAIDLLLDLGANINQADSEGNNCLHFAVKSGDDRVVKKLLIRGADKNARNYKGNTPYDLAVKKGFCNIAEILEDKKCNLFTNPCGQFANIADLQSNRNNVFLFVIIFIFLVIKWVYLSRVSYYKEHRLKYDNFPFLPGLTALGRNCDKEKYENCTLTYERLERTKEKYRITSITQLFTNSTLFYDNLEEIFTVFWGFSVFEPILIFFVLKFLCFSKNIFVKKKTYQKCPSLIKLFEENKNICVKCRNAKDEKTVHCIVCNSCVQNFDHHCSWLNLCINHTNINWFLAFIYIFFIYMLLNLLFFIYNFYLFYTCLEDNFYYMVLDLDEKDENFNRNKKISKILLCIFDMIIAVLCFYTLAFVVIPVICARCKEKMRRKNEAYAFNGQIININDQPLVKDIDRLTIERMPK